MFIRARRRTIRGVQITIEFQSAHPLRGWVRRAGAAPAPFVGWLSLLGMLERLAASLEGAPPGSRGDPPSLPRGDPP